MSTAETGGGGNPGRRTGERERLNWPRQPDDQMESKYLNSAERRQARVEEDSMRKPSVCVFVWVKQLAACVDSGTLVWLPALRALRCQNKAKSRRLSRHVMCGNGEACVHESCLLLTTAQVHINQNEAQLKTAVSWLECILSECVLPSLACNLPHVNLTTTPNGKSCTTAYCIKYSCVR